MEQVFIHCRKPFTKLVGSHFTFPCMLIYFVGLGLSPNITERELFDCPSRTARLIAAWYDFSAEVADTIWYVDMAFY